MTKWVGQKRDILYNGEKVRATIVDIEFETGFGPMFLMRTPKGQLFWAVRKEMKERVSYEETS